ncbi:hypothetical protein ACJRO7_012284 [Eucalyptus globulus]|uniref:Uncharacterized protein n=1 Tax=Eucalyptus globulus TaxID=34317 RepID=A0ABD3LNM4_EUCGL
MYHLRNRPEALVEFTPGVRGNGYLVIDGEDVHCCCFGLGKERRLYEFPFPQNKDLTIWYPHESTKVYKYEVLMIPSSICPCPAISTGSIKGMIFLSTLHSFTSSVWS